MECATSEWLEMVIAQSILLLWRMCQYGAMLYRSWNVQTMLASATGWSCLCMLSQAHHILKLSTASRIHAHVHIHVDTIDFLIFSLKQCLATKQTLPNRTGLETLVKAKPNYKGRGGLTAKMKRRLTSAAHCAIKMRSTQPDKKGGSQNCNYCGCQSSDVGC